MLSLDSLRKPFTRAQAMTRIVELLTSLGFETTAWQEGSIQRTTITLLAIMYSDLSEVVKAIAEFGFNSYASGDSLREFSRSRYQQDKQPAVKTRGTIRLTSTASIPYTIQPGQLIVANSLGTQQYRNVTGGVLAAGSVAVPTTLDLTFDAVLAGSNGNASNGTITRMITPLAGVTCNNNVGSPWYSVTGADEESDASMRLRNSTKWATLTVELVRDSYENIARTAGARKVAIDDSNPRGPGTIDIYPAADNAQLGTSTMAAIQAAFAARAFQTDTTGSNPWGSATSRVRTIHPPLSPLAITATLYHDPGTSGAVVAAAATQALQDFLILTPVGGWDYSPGPTNVVKREDLIEVLQAVDGMRSVTLTTPAADVTVAPTALVTAGTWTLNTQAVAS